MSTKVTFLFGWLCNTKNGSQWDLKQKKNNINVLNKEIYSSAYPVNKNSIWGKYCALSNKKSVTFPLCFEMHITYMFSLTDSPPIVIPLLAPFFSYGHFPRTYTTCVHTRLHPFPYFISRLSFLPFISYTFSRQYHIVIDQPAQQRESQVKKRSKIYIGNLKWLSRDKSQLLLEENNK